MNDEKRRPRVCHVVATTLGATWMFEQLRDLRDRHGYEVCAVVNAHEGPLVDLFRSENIPFHVCDFGLAGPRRAWSLLRATVDLTRVFRAGRFDVVQTHIFLSTLAARPAAWIAGVPVRLSMIAGPFHLEAVASRLVDRLTQWMDTCLIPSCEKSLRLCLEIGVPLERLRLIYYSADTARFAPSHSSAGLRQEFGWPEDTPVIALVAYFYPRLGHGPWIPKSLHGRAVKGHEDLIRAVPKVLARHPRARFVLVGGAFAGAGEFLQEMKDLVTRLGLQERIVFTGHRKDVSALLSDASVAVQASLCENLGGTLEALSMARPLVATRVGGMPDVVRHGETGFLAEPREPDDLARKICDVLDDPRRAEELGRRGRALMIERFSLERTVGDLDDLYRAQLAVHQKTSVVIAVSRAAIAGPWLAWVWLRAALLNPSPVSGLKRRATNWLRSARAGSSQPAGARWSRPVPTGWSEGIGARLRLRAHLTNAALTRWSYRLWVACAPGIVREAGRKIRRHLAERRIS